MNISYFLLGYVKIKVDYCNVVPLLNLCMDRCIPYSDFESYDDGVSMKFHLFSFKKLKKEANAQGINYNIDKICGIPRLIERYKYRFGLHIGLILVFFMVFFAHRYIWDITVSGNTNVTSSEIRELLKEQGFGVGSYIPLANTDRIENKIMIESDKISWMSINIIGTVAEVQIRENVPKSESDAVTGPSNIVASKSGIVEELRIWRGNSVVRAGQYVEKGELLISGLYDSERVGLRYTRASGEVYARTVSEIYIDIPLEYEEKCYTGEEYCNKYLNFFDYSINISKKYGKEGVLYDKINIVENCCLYGGIQTPFSVITEKFMAYDVIRKTRSYAQAEELAYYSLEKSLSEISENAMIIEKNIVPYIRENSYSLICTAVVIENIAEESEFEVNYGSMRDETGK